MRPEELVFLANNWRNLQVAAEREAEQLRAHGLQGSIVFYADAVALNARTCAEQLEERAEHLEQGRSS